MQKMQRNFWLFVLLTLSLNAAQLPYKFSFTDISAAPKYSDETGSGLEDTASPAPPYYFSTKVPEEGNYRVTVSLGNAKLASTTTVKAELRRLMLENIQTAAGQYVTKSFIVNVRTPQLPGGGQVKLKEREKTSEAWAWDDRITLEFSGTNPSVRSIMIEKADNVPTIYIAGDSTSTDQPLEPFNSWGQMLPVFFKPNIAIANNGESGESLRSFISENRLAKVMSVIRPGDYLFIQMGHNDQKEKGEGVGAFTTYKASIERLITEARQHQANPVLITSMNRLTFDDNGKINNSLGDYPEAVRQVARQENLPLIDLNAMSKSLYEAIGPKDAHLLFAGSDTTHHSDYGSYEFAKCIVQGIRENHLPIAKDLVDGLPAFDPARPDTMSAFHVPTDPTGAVHKPYGN